MGYGNSVKTDHKAIETAVANKQCVACDNFRAVHPRTKLSYCMDGSKTALVDSGCASWKRMPNAEVRGCANTELEDVNEQV